MTKLRSTYTWEYEADPKNYDGETDPKVMAQTDRVLFENDPGIIDGFIDLYPITITVEVVEA